MSDLESLFLEVSEEFLEEHECFSTRGGPSYRALRQYLYYKVYMPNDPHRPLLPHALEATRG